MSSAKKGKRNWATLPLTRVSTIMRSSPEVKNVSEDAVVITAKAAELFLAHLAQSAYQKGDNKEVLDYSDIANEVASNSQMCFLKDMIPKKIKVREYREIMKKLEEEEASRRMSSATKEDPEHSGDSSVSEDE